MRLRVSNLINTVTKEMLLDLFEEFGEVDSVKIFRHPGDATCLCFIEMDRERDALEAIDELNGEELSGLRIKVERSQDVFFRKPAVKPITLDDDDDNTPVLTYKKEAVPDDFVAVEDAEEEEEFSYDKKEEEE